MNTKLHSGIMFNSGPNAPCNVIREPKDGWLSLLQRYLKGNTSNFHHYCQHWQVCKRNLHHIGHLRHMGQMQEILLFFFFFLLATGVCGPADCMKSEKEFHTVLYLFYIVNCLQMTKCNRSILYCFVCKEF